MTTTIVRAGGFAELTGRMFGTVKVLSFAGYNPVRWQVACQVPGCGSHWIEQHHRLTESGNLFKCRNVSCQLGRVQAPKPIVERDEPLLPEPARVNVSREYQLYSNYMRQNGFGDSDIGTWDEWQRLGSEYRERLLQPALIAEEAALKRRELEAIGLAVENNERERFRRTHGEI